MIVECRICKKLLEQNKDNFYMRKDCSAGFLSACKECINRQRVNKNENKRKNKKEIISNQYEDFIFC